MVTQTSTRSLFKQHRKQRLRLLLFLFVLGPLIFEIKTHYFIDSEQFASVDTVVPTVKKFNGKVVGDDEDEDDVSMMNQRNQLGRLGSSSHDGNDDDDDDDSSSSSAAHRHHDNLPKYLEGEEASMKYIEEHRKGSSSSGARQQRASSSQRRAWISSSSSGSNSNNNNSNNSNKNRQPDKRFYDAYLKNAIENKPAYPLLKGFLRTVIDLYPESKSWFDGGAGTCGTMKALRSAGKIVRGIEISDVSKTSCKDLAKEGVVETGVLHDLTRFEDKRFDVVFSSEVLEHVPTNLVEKSVKELVRIAKKDVFVTISLRRSGLDPKDLRKPAIVHLTVWPREKWEKTFTDAGCEINKDALKYFKNYDESKFGAKPNFFAFKCH